MLPILHYHPLSSFCWKVLIALYESDTAFEAKPHNPGDAAERSAFKVLWPTAKIPLLEDGGRIVPETSIIIEYLDRHHPGEARLLPEDPEERLQVRLWDRLFDQYVMLPMQRFVAQELRRGPERDPRAVSEALGDLGTGYDLVEQRMGPGTWAVGEGFSMADCAAAPALFYAVTIRPFPPGHAKLEGYFERLLARPSVRRVIAEARPWFRHFPLRHAIAPRHLAEPGDPA
jgi:glutathione S-transferase